MFFPLLLGSVAESHTPQTEREFPAQPESVAEARRFVLAATKGESASGDLGMRLSAVVSELATNAVLHARSMFQVKVSPGKAAIRVAVRDASSSVPVKKPYGPSQPTGKGLVIVESMADRWGVEAEEDGKTVWFEIDMSSRD